ncbi:MAG: 4-alpha-glucanotransferase, partial [Chitinophagaceae bacterium]
PFKNIIFQTSDNVISEQLISSDSHLFKVKAPLLKSFERLCIIGNIPALGEWVVENAIPMFKDGNWWTVSLDLHDSRFPIKYKYGVYDEKTNRFVEYESGEDRILHRMLVKQKQTIIHDGFARLPNNTWHGAGLSIPVFSIRTEKSCGIGEFSDLMALVDWAKKIGFKLIQILPVNDTISSGTWVDSYPYSAISAFALHPIYLNLEKVAGEDFASSLASLNEKKMDLNALPSLDYEKVMQFKMDVIQNLFFLQKDKTFSSAGFNDFFEDNKEWLIAYAVFSYHRDLYKTADFTKWDTFSTFNDIEVLEFASPKKKHYEGIGFYYFIQYHLHLQLKEAHDYANSNGIVIKGDIPIGVNRNSVDAWMNPDLYFMDQQAGAPPDDFAVKGQNWGFPTYNWSRMQQDNFAWWSRRFHQMSRYFDAFRIDHILGFFRIWSIPDHAIEGIMGHFVPAIPLLVSEFHQRGIHFDFERFCKPYITDSVLWEMFGPNEKWIKPYLESFADGRYILKDSFDTQKKVENHFKDLQSNEENERIMMGLFDLISNVILFEEENSAQQKFHFRFNIASTFSFRYLDLYTQQQLQELYIDYFFRRQDTFWEKEALLKLPALKRASDMLICGEDLGMVPSCVPEVMNQLGILSLEIQRMPKDPQKEFFHPNDAPYLSVVTPSTHDMSTIRGWWEEDRNKTQRFYNLLLGQYGQAPAFCEAWVNKLIITQHLYSPAMWAIFQIQDILGMNEKLRRQDPHEERINIPAIAKHYWKYRVHLSIEELMNEHSFNQELQELLFASGRN